MRAAAGAVGVVTVVAALALGGCGGERTFLPEAMRTSFAEARQAFDRGDDAAGCAAIRRGFARSAEAHGMGLRGPRAAQVDVLLQQIGDLALRCGDPEGFFPDTVTRGNTGAAFAELHDRLLAAAERRATWGSYAWWLVVVAVGTFVAWGLRRLRPAR